MRKEQDLGKQINAQLGTLNNVCRSLERARRKGVIRAINASIDKLRAERDKARAEINRRFPPMPTWSIRSRRRSTQIKATLAPGEAMLSFYFGRESSFVWAVPKDGPVAFAAIPATAGDIEAKVRKLREALEPQAAMVSDIPAVRSGARA